MGWGDDPLVAPEAAPAAPNGGGWGKDPLVTPEPPVTAGKPPSHGAYGKQEQPEGAEQASGWLRAPMDMVNNLIGSMQGTSPQIADAQGNMNYRRLGTLGKADYGDVVVPDDKNATEWPTLDPSKHVVFFDPQTGKPTVYERNKQMTESGPTSAGRLLQLGANAPATAPVARTAAGAESAVERLKDFANAGVPPNMPAATQSRTLGQIAKTAQDVPYAGASVTSAMRDTMGKTQEAAGNVAARFGQAATPEEGGEALKSGYASFKSDFQDKAEKLYGAIPIKGDQLVLPEQTASALEGISQRFPSNPELGATLQPSKFKQWQDILQKGGTLTWDELQQFRSFVGRNISRPAGELGVGPDDMRRLYSGLSADMEGAASEAGPAALNAYTRANKYYAAGLDRLNTALDFINRADNPEKAYYGFTRMASQRGQGADIQTLTRVMRSMPEEARGDVASSVINRLGLPTKGQAGQGGNFSLSSFVSNYADLAPAAKDALFGSSGSANRESLDTLARVTSYLKNVERLGNPSGTFRESMTAGTGVGLWERPLDTLTALLASYAGGKALMSPTLTKWAIGASAAIKQNSPQWPRYLSRLQGMADRQPELKQLYDFLLDNQPDNKPG